MFSGRTFHSFWTKSTKTYVTECFTFVERHCCWKKKINISGSSLTMFCQIYTYPTYQLYVNIWNDILTFVGNRCNVFFELSSVFQFVFHICYTIQYNTAIVNVRRYKRKKQLVSSDRYLRMLLIHEKKLS